MHVLFVDDKAMPGWSIVLKKEARGKRISSIGMEHCLGQEESNGDVDAFSKMGRGGRNEGGDENDYVDGTEAGGRPRRTRLQ